MTTVYGIATCSTVQKALAWLDGHGIAYRFHDFRKDGVPEDKLRAWCARLGWEKVMNRASLTFRNLSDADKANLTAAKAIVLMRTKPTLIRRPVLETETFVLQGFAEKHYAEAFGVKA